MSNRYARSQIVLHWLTLLLVILTYSAMLLKDSMPEAWGPVVKNLHFNFGVSVFALMLIRLAVRAFRAAPPITPRWRNGRKWAPRSSIGCCTWSS